MRKEQAANFNQRTIMVLVNEARRLDEAAERVRLLIHALAMSNGVALPVVPTQVHD